MKLTFLGTASGFAAYNRRSTALLIGHKDTTILLDAGDSVTAGYLQASGDPQSIDAVFLSHSHADHISGLPLFLQWLHLSKRTADLPIYIDEERISWLRNMLAGMYLIPERLSYRFELLPYPEGTVGDIAVRTYPNRHLEKLEDLAAQHGLSINSRYYDVEADGKKLVVSSDITGIDEVAAKAEQADCLVIEVTHVPLEDVFAFAVEHPNLRIILTHIPHEIDDSFEDHHQIAVSQFGDRVRFAFDGMTATV